MGDAVHPSAYRTVWSLRLPTGKNPNGGPVEVAAHLVLDDGNVGPSWCAGQVKEVEDVGVFRQVSGDIGRFSV
jgi:hypothetical protein